MAKGNANTKPPTNPDAQQQTNPAPELQGDTSLVAGTPGTTSAPPHEMLARPMAPESPKPAAPTPEMPKPAVQDKPAAPAPYAVDLLVMVCPRCTSRDTMLVPERGNGPDWVRAHCNPCKRDFKVPLSATAKA